jgi:hypothetical protein
MMASESKDDAPEAHKQNRETAGEIYARFTERGFSHRPHLCDCRDDCCCRRLDPPLVGSRIAARAGAQAMNPAKNFSWRRVKNVWIVSAICRATTKMQPAFPAA